MRALRFVLVLAFTVVSTVGFVTIADGANVIFLLGDEFAPNDGDQAQIDIFDDRGDVLDFWDNTRLQDDPIGALDAADAADLVYIGESISSGRADALIPTTTPVINNEQFAFDNWFLTDLNVGHGSPGRPRDGAPIVAGSSFGTQIDIVDPDHPIAKGAGLEGLIQIYDDPGGRIDWGEPFDTADIVATIPGSPSAGAIFVYEAGDDLFDPFETAAGMRIGFWLSNTNRGPEPADPNVQDDAADGAGPGFEATLLTDAGKALLNSTIDFALGIEPSTEVCGDFDMDGDVDSADRTIQTTNWTGALPPGDPNATKTFAQGDCDADGDVDTADQNGTITNWTGAMNPAGNLEDGEDADLLYDPATGNVKLDAGDTASRTFISFVLGTGENNMRPENLVESAPGNAGPFFDVGTNTDATTFQIGQTDPLNQGAGPVIDLGEIFPAGMSRAELVDYLTLAEYASELGSGGTLDIPPIPEPSSLGLAMIGLLSLAMRRRCR